MAALGVALIIITVAFVAVFLAQDAIDDLVQ